MTSVLEGVRAALMTAVADIDAHVADSAMEREIALAAVARHRADAAGDSDDALAAFAEADTALWELVEKYAARIDVARAVGHAPPVVVPARRPTIELDTPLVGVNRTNSRQPKGNGSNHATDGVTSAPVIPPSENAVFGKKSCHSDGSLSLGKVSLDKPVNGGSPVVRGRKAAVRPLDEVIERVVARHPDTFDGDDGRTHSEADLPPLPSQSSIKAGPSAAQTTMLGRTATPPGCPCCGQRAMKAGVRCAACAISCTRTGDTWKRGKMCPAQPAAVAASEPAQPPAPERGSAWRGKMAPRPEEAKARREQRTAAPPPIPVGTQGPSVARPAGLKVAPVAPPRVGEDLRRAAKVDPIAAVSGGARGGGLLL